MMGLPLEEIAVGQTLELGTYAFTRDNVLAFARKYDPQPFHVDDAAAARGPFGKLAASGWHTAAAWMKCYIATNQRGEAERRAAGLRVYETRPSPGFDNLRWLKPVFPGDSVRYRTTVTAKRDLVTRPDMGLLFSRNEGFNQHGELVYSFDGKVLALKRQA